MRAVLQTGFRQQALANAMYTLRRTPCPGNRFFSDTPYPRYMWVQIHKTSIKLTWILKGAKNMLKRIVCLLSAIILVFALAAPAFAAGSTGDVAEPNGIPRCQCNPPTVVTRWDEPNFSYRYTTCFFKSHGYPYLNCYGDYNAVKYEGAKCTKCGNSTNRTAVDWGTYCPTLGDYLY